MPNLIDLTLWGLPLLVFVEAILNFVAWLKPLGDKAGRILRGALMAAGFLFVTYLEQLVGLWPWVGVYGPGVIWALAAFLVFAGFLKLEDLLTKAVDTYYNIRGYTLDESANACCTDGQLLVVNPAPGVQPVGKMYGPHA